ncbi:hypothetical protein DFP72DRAFT_851999 [Ephemerocybe angulata]|uniref:Uncharacterized protein n=1 Tax=Ephemerocybe angulata TaxID=980116 RepID=A0A8H6HP20_9AGAR|nr:hypothetical protein DFP72DRAFT_851999 [Tulosesus angulatus]
MSGHTHWNSGLHYTSAPSSSAGPGPSSMSMSMPETSPRTFLEMVAGATHEELILSRNPAYSALLKAHEDLRDDNKKMFFELEALKGVNNTLKELVHNPPPAPVIDPTLTALSNSSSSSSSSASPPPPPVPVDHTAVEPLNCYFWDQADWAIKLAEYKSMTGPNVGLLQKYGFLVDKNGKFFETTQRKSFNKKISGAFTDLYHEGLDPVTWSVGGETVKEYVIHKLISFDITFASKNGWKCIEYASIQYPTWTSKVRPGLGPRKKSKLSENAHNEIKQQKSELRANAKAASASKKTPGPPPPGTKVIDVDNTEAMTQLREEKRLRDAAKSKKVEVKKEATDGDEIKIKSEPLEGSAITDVVDVELKEGKVDRKEDVIDLKDLKEDDDDDDDDGDDDDIKLPETVAEEKEEKKEKARSTSPVEEIDLLATAHSTSAGIVVPSSVTEGFKGSIPVGPKIPPPPAKPSSDASKKRKADEMEGLKEEAAVPSNAWNPPQDRYTGKGFGALAFKADNPEATEKDFEHSWRSASKEAKDAYTMRANEAKKAAGPSTKKNQNCSEILVILCNICAALFRNSHPISKAQTAADIFMKIHPFSGRLSVVSHWALTPASPHMRAIQHRTIRDDSKSQQSPFPSVFQLTLSTLPSTFTLDLASFHAVRREYLGEERGGEWGSRSAEVGGAGRASRAPGWVSGTFPAAQSPSEGDVNVEPSVAARRTEVNRSVTSSTMQTTSTNFDSHRGKIVLELAIAWGRWHRKWTVPWIQNGRYGSIRRGGHGSMSDAIPTSTQSCIETISSCTLSDSMEGGIECNREGVVAGTMVARACATVPSIREPQHTPFLLESPMEPHGILVMGSHIPAQSYRGVEVDRGQIRPSQ